MMVGDIKGPRTGRDGATVLLGHVTPAEKEGTMSCVELRTGVLRFRADLAGRCTYLSSEWESLSPIPRSTVLNGDGWVKAIYAVDLLAVMPAWVKAVQCRERFEMNYRIIGHGGLLVSVLGVAWPVDDGFEGRVEVSKKGLPVLASPVSIRTYISGTTAAQCSGNLQPGVKGTRRLAVNEHLARGGDAMEGDKVFRIDVIDEQGKPVEPPKVLSGYLARGYVNGVRLVSDITHLRAVVTEISLASLLCDSHGKLN